MQRFGMPDPAHLVILHRNIGTGDITFGNYTRFLLDRVYVEVFRNNKGVTLSDRVGLDEGRTLMKYAQDEFYEECNRVTMRSISRYVYSAKLYLISKDGQHVHDQ